MTGTAPPQTHWLFIEAPGAWGRDALADNSLDEQQCRALAGLPPHWRAVLVRRPDRPLRRQRDRLVWTSTPQRVDSWLLPTDAPLHPDELPGPSPAAGEALFLCTNGARDRCCALRGRPLLDALDRRDVWECSHLGGHRFAPTAVRLSDRLVFGRLDPASARAVLGGATPLDRLRGPAGWPSAVQAAAAEVWRQHPGPDLAAAAQDAGHVLLRMEDGSRWRVCVEEVPVEPRALSCGADPVPGSALRTGPAVRLGTDRPR